MAFGTSTNRGSTDDAARINTSGVERDDRNDAAKPADYNKHGNHVEVSQTIQRTPEELYAQWRPLENLPQIMSHLKSVTVLDDKRSHWVAKGPAGTEVEWDAEIIQDIPGQVIAWRSLAGAKVDNAGSVRFTPAIGDRGTEIRVVLDYIPPAGVIGKVVAKLFGEEPQGQIEDDLRKFKQLMETGEVSTVDGQSRGNCKN